MELDLRLAKRDAALQDSKKTMNKLIKGATESRQLLQDTLNVKLRYEEIIKAILENETKGNLRSAHAIIANT